MKNFDEKLSQFNNSNHINLFYEFGMNPDDIKSSIIETFQKYFQNTDNLKKYAISDLVPNWLSYLTISRDSPDSLKFINPLLKIFNDAKKTDKNKTFEIFNEHLPDLSQAISRFWSLYNTQSHLSDLCDEDFLEECLRIIGQSTEGISKSFLKLLLHLSRVIKLKEVTYTQILSFDLGSIINELSNLEDLKDLFIINPYNIRLNQWRNIAYHHNSKIINNKIYCILQSKDSNQEFEFTKAELLNSVKRILIIFNLLRLAESIFYIDNIEEIQTNVGSSNESENKTREESKLLDLHSSISSQGFQIIDLKYDEFEAILDVKDMEEYGDFTKRAIHSSQFLYNLWKFSNSKNLRVSYFLFTNEKFFTSEIKAAAFKKNLRGNATYSTMMKGVKYPFIITDYLQDKNPFQNLSFSKEIKNFSQKYYSQKGKNITVEEFSKQFILSIFCNYLALRSEGFDKIFINIGSDGSLARTETPIAIVMHVPAVIKSKDLQKELIGLLNSVIKLYETKQLQREVVIETKYNNQYYTKKGMIKRELMKSNL